MRDSACQKFRHDGMSFSWSTCLLVLQKCEDYICFKHIFSNFTPSFQGTTIQEAMMPSILQLIEKLHKRQLNYLGLTNTGLSEQMFGAILEELKSYKSPAHTNDQETRAVLEMNRGSSQTISLTQEQYHKFLDEGKRLRMDIRMSAPLNPPLHLKKSIQSRDNRQERRSRAKVKSTQYPLYVIVFSFIQIWKLACFVCHLNSACCCTTS